jgi:uncharacterized protein (TIGR01777 family)
MQVAVSGSHGLIGTALFAALRDRGHDPIRLVRERASPGEIGWDPARGTLDAASLEGLDAVVHLAGAGIASRRWSASQRARIWASRVDATRLLVRTLAGLSRPPAVLVSASGVGYYGSRGDELLVEESPPGAGFLSELCVAWEDASGTAGAAGVRVVLLRSGIVLARHGGVLKPQVSLFKLGLGGRLGSGRQYLSWITLEDEVAIVLHALEQSSLSGPLNAVGPGPVTNEEFTRTLARVLSRPALLVAPTLVLRGVLGAGFADELLLASQRAWPGRLLETGFLFRHPDLEGALRAMLAASATQGGGN